MLTKQLIRDTVFENGKNINFGQSDMILAPITKYVNPSVVENDIDWDEFIENLKFMVYYSDSDKKKTLQQAIKFIKEHTKH